MLKLKITSRYKLVLLFLLILVFIRIQLIPKESSLNSGDVEFVGRIVSIKNKGDYIKIKVKVNQEKIIGNLYDLDINLEYNDLVKITGVLKMIEDDCNFYGFSYKDYGNRHNQFYNMSIDRIEVLEKNTNFFYKIKNIVVKRINKIETYAYLHAFLLGDTSYINEQVLKSYRTNGISHLFAISGMHLSFFTKFIEKILNKFDEYIRFIIISLFILFYSCLVGLTPSVLRASFLYIFTFFTKKPLKSLLIAFILIILLNPYNLLEIGFQFSFLMSFILILFSKKLNGLSGIKRSINLAIITFISSVSLMILYFNQINIFTPIYNVFYMGFVSLIIFPLSFVVFIIPYLSPIYQFFIFVLEKTSCFFSNITFSIWIMREPNILVFIILLCLTVLIIYFIYLNKHFVIIIFFFFIFLYHNINFFLKENYMTVLNVGQGDCLLLYSMNDVVLIDTGGSLYTNMSMADSKIIPYLKAMGIIKIDTLILTHGDFDHIGEAINLVENFKVEKVIFNCGEYNDLELELIKALNEKKIKYYSCIKELNIDKNKLYFLNNKDYGNENDNSSVIYTELNNHKFLFMGDAGVEVEQDLIEKYNLQNIDVLKVGHHGSKTSSSRSFIDEINPKCGVISVGKNNRYGHPNKEVLENLRSSKIYRTDKDGSIIFKIKNNKLEIKTCEP